MPLLLKDALKMSDNTIKIKKVQKMQNKRLIFKIFNVKN